MIARFTAEFTDPDAERAYRTSQLANTARRITTMGVLGVMIIGVYVGADIFLAGFDRGVLLMLAWALPMAVVALWIARRVHTDTRRAMDLRPLASVEVVACVGFLVGQVFRVEQAGAQSASLSVLLVAIYFLIPGRFPTMLVIGGSVTLGFVAVMVAMPIPMDQRLLQVVSALVFGGLVAYLANVVERVRREEFRAMLELTLKQHQLTEEIAERQAVERELRRLAAHDPLTGLLNRRALHDRTSALLGGEGATRPVSILAIDIDRFKSVNDTYGHPIGDAALQSVADACRAALRDWDLLARTGGEEFVAVLSDADARTAEAVARRVTESVSDAVVPDAVDIDLSVCVGVAQHRPGDDLDATIRTADRGLYTAKARGSGSVVVEGWGPLARV